MNSSAYHVNPTKQVKSQPRYSMRKYQILAHLVITVVSLGPYSLSAESPDKPVSLLRLRGFMVDPPRTPESMDYYRRLIAFSADWGFNTLVFRIADDQGAAIRFESHPEFFTHKNALTTAQVRELVAHAQQRGVELIPEIESFGHTKFITAVEQYADLRDHDPKNVDKRSSTFSGVIPSHPKVLRLFEDIYRETAALFPSHYLHGGCDEVAWGDSEFTKRILKTKSRAQVWAQYINDLNGIARKAGKEFIIWGDHPLNEDPEILGYLSKDIILMDWEYSRTDPKVVEAAARKVLGNGMRVIGAPSLIN
jgi:N-acetyl-beta-hexosaminidase